MRAPDRRQYNKIVIDGVQRILKTDYITGVDKLVFCITQSKSYKQFFIYHSWQIAINHGGNVDAITDIGSKMFKI